MLHYLVIEVASDSTTITDYRAKRVEYNVLNIPEYWIVDPLKSCITLLQSVDELYEETRYINNDLMRSAIFPDLALTVEQVLMVG